MGDRRAYRVIENARAIQSAVIDAVEVVWHLQGTSRGAGKLAEELFLRVRYLEGAMNGLVGYSGHGHSASPPRARNRFFHAPQARGPHYRERRLNIHPTEIVEVLTSLLDWVDDLCCQTASELSQTSLTLQQVQTAARKLREAVQSLQTFDGKEITA